MSFDGDSSALTPHPLTEVDLTAAAEWLIMLRDDRDLGLAYAACLSMWMELTGAHSNDAALTYAEQLHAAYPARTVAVVPPL